MDLSLFFAGTAGSMPSPSRGLPAVLVRAGGDRILFDCGEGTQRQLIRSVGLPELDAIFITHFHADHWLGIPGMLKTFDMREREKPLAIYGPSGLKQLFATWKTVLGRIGYPLDLHELDPHEEVRLSAEYLISAFPVDHSVPTFGYAFVEDDRPGHFDPDAAQKLGIKPGPDFAALQRGETVDGVAPEQVMGEPRRGRKIVFSGDTAPCQAVEVFAHQADLLVHEATFTEDDRARARQTNHSTAAQAAEVAKQAEAVLLALVHTSVRYFPREIPAEAQRAFTNTVLPRDFDVIEVPFPERGEPRLVKDSSSP